MHTVVPGVWKNIKNHGKLQTKTVGMKYGKKN